MDTSMNRREFLATLGLGGAAVAGAGLVGSNSGLAWADEAAIAAAEAETAAAERGSNPATAPIPPVDPPATWDGEYDMVIVGSGGAGLNAASRARQLGMTALVIEKLPGIGGNSRNATMFTIPGGTAAQNEAEVAIPSYPFDVDAWSKYIMMGSAQGCNPDMLHMIGENLSVVFDWMTETYNIEWVLGPGGVFYQTAPIGMDKIIDAALAYGQEQGAEYITDTEVVALVQDGDRIVGVKAKNTDGNELYYKGNKAVLLAGGGFATNRDLLAEWCPSALRRAASCYLSPSDTGECFRMGLGVGASVINENSFTMFDGGMDWLAEGKGDWTHYLYDGATQLVRQPWLNIKADGTRNRYIDSLQLGALTDQAYVETSSLGSRSYVIFDKNWDEYMQTFGQKACREPIQEGVARAPMMPEYYQDYHAGVQYAMDQGMIKECETLDELAEALGLDAGVLNEAVEHWNANVAAGVDDAVFPYPEEWLHPIDTPPYYGAKIGGNLFMTVTGLNINTNMQVLNEVGVPIPGLYAGWHTAGGALAADSACSMSFETGGVSKSYLSGYIAANAIAELEA